MEFFSILKKIELDDYEKSYQKSRDELNRVKDNKKILNYLEEERNDYQVELDQLFDNNTFNKFRKYKLVYFLYGSWIYYQSFVNKDDSIFNLTQKAKDFFVLDYSWLAFQQGPLIKDTYNYGQIDKEIELNYAKWNSKEKEFFSNAWRLLNRYTTNELIEQSHKTTPWINNWRPGSYYAKINNKEIIAYFKANDLFFFAFNKRLV